MSVSLRSAFEAPALALALVVACLAGTRPAGAGDAPEGPDISFEAITYGGGIGCGLYVELFRNGGLAADDEGRTGGFVLGSPPDRSVAQCLQRCEEGLSKSFIRLMKSASRADQATGWCFKGRDVIGGPYVDLPR